MNRTIVVTDTSTVKREVQISHPVFRRYGDTLDSGLNYEIFERWDADGTEWSITEENRPGGAVSFEIERSRRVSGAGADGADFICGLGRYACTPEKFNAVFQRALAFLKSIESAT